MKNSKEIRSGRHCVFLLHAHLVFVTKYRRNVFDQHALDLLREIFSRVCEKFEATLVEFNGESDHVHLEIQYPPKISLSRLVNSLKGASSRVLRRRYPKIADHYYRNVLWSPSYFAGSCGGASLDVLRKYIEQQQTPD
jgi:putative transposase